MDVDTILKELEKTDFQLRIKALSALREHSNEIAVPILITHTQDPEFLVRSFVAKELGLIQSPESFSALLEMAKKDNTPNVRAEAANSLSLSGGKASIAHLVSIFSQDEHWLVRRSILAVLLDMECLSEILEVCDQGLKGADLSVKESSIVSLGTLVTLHGSEEALLRLLDLTTSEINTLRIRVASVLRKIDRHEAKQALAEMKLDPDPRVELAAMGDLL